MHLVKFLIRCKYICLLAMSSGGEQHSNFDKKADTTKALHECTEQLCIIIYRIP